MLFFGLLVSIGHSHSISRQRPRKPSQKFNMCNFVASSQAFVAKGGIASDHWCPYIMRHRVPLCVLLTHVWKPGFRQALSTTELTCHHCLCVFQVSFVTQGVISDSKAKSVTFSITIAPPRNLAQYPVSYVSQAPAQDYQEFEIDPAFTGKTRGN